VPCGLLGKQAQESSRCDLLFEGMDLAFEEHLKFRLLANGVRVHPDATATWRDIYGGPLTLAEYATTIGVTLRLPRDLYVNAPIANHAETPDLRVEGTDFFLSDKGIEVPIEVIPVPAFHRHTYEDKGSVRPLTDLGITHTDRCRVSPIAGCSWACSFCDLPFEHNYRRKDSDQLLKLIQIAQHDRLAPARHVLVSGGTPGRLHEPWIDDVYQFLARESPLPVDIMMPPREDLGYPDWLRSTGVNSLSINLEVFDLQRARAITPNKARRFTRDHFLDYIERAVESFGVGSVQSLLVFGSAIEPTESTLAGLRELVVRGCIPVLSMFRPHPSTPLSQAPSATLEEIETVYLRSLEICEEVGNGVLPGPRCIPCQHNTVTLPLDGEFYLADSDEYDSPCLTS
jgi:Radical SAM superfamily